jgi:hypothetical protein
MVAATFGAALTFGVARGGAADIVGSLLTCQGYSYSQPFSAWGDQGSYFLAPGGSFEGASSWTLAGGAQIVPGNEPFFLDSTSDSHSLLLPAGSSATTPSMCMAALSPDLRFVGKSTGGAGVRVDVYSTGVLGLAKLVASTNVSLGSTWAPTSEIQLLLANVMAVTNVGTTSLSLRFTPIGSGSVQIDDVYVDPCLHEG